MFTQIMQGRASQPPVHSVNPAGARRAAPALLRAAHVYADYAGAGKRTARPFGQPRRGAACRARFAGGGCLLEESRRCAGRAGAQACPCTLSPFTIHPSHFRRKAAADAKIKFQFGNLISRLKNMLFYGCTYICAPCPKQCKAACGHNGANLLTHITGGHPDEYS